MTNADIIKAIEQFARPSYQESWDNTGVQVGDVTAECTGVLISLDVTPEVVEEACRKNCSLIVSHHPLLFKGLRSVTGRTPVEHCLLECIRHGITVYSNHTAADSTRNGVSYAMAKKIGATVRRVLNPLTERLIHVDVTVERSDAPMVELLLFEAGSTDEPSTIATVDSTLTIFNPTKADPAGEAIPVDTMTVSANMPSDRLSSIQRAIDELPCQVYATRFTRLEDVDSRVGLGVFATLNMPLDAPAFIERIKAEFGVPVVRTTRLPQSEHTISRIAMCGGSGGEFISRAASMGAQAYISADIRYHDFVDWQDRILLIDIGHYSSEECIKRVFFDVITKKFANFAVFISEVESNPVKYH